MLRDPDCAGVACIHSMWQPTTKQNGQEYPGRENQIVTKVTFEVADLKVLQDTKAGDKKRREECKPSPHIPES
jgi:hypothetical protein